MFAASSSEILAASPSFVSALSIREASNIHPQSRKTRRFSLRPSAVLPGPPTAELFQLRGRLAGVKAFLTCPAWRRLAQRLRFLDMGTAMVPDVSYRSFGWASINRRMLCGAEFARPDNLEAVVGPSCRGLRPKIRFGSQGNLRLFGPTQQMAGSPGASQTVSFERAARTMQIKSNASVIADFPTLPVDQHRGLSSRNVDSRVAS
jgi:hypothetical protein